MSSQETLPATSIAAEIHDLTVTYHHKPVLWAIDCVVPEGSLCSIVGPNGAGKSTLLKSMMGLLPLASGHIEFFGKKLDQVRTRIGYVPQREEVDWDFPVTVFDVVLMGRYGRLSLFSRPSKLDRERAEEALEQVGMSALRSRQISQLSGGQQQRVFLARALCQEADLYLMDEPFAGVDAATEGAVIELLRSLRDCGKTIICVHHDLNTVHEYFDWTVLLHLRLVAAGKTSEVFTKENLVETYGGRLGLLTEVTEQLRKQEWNGRT